MQSATLSGAFFGLAGAGAGAVWPAGVSVALVGGGDAVASEVVAGLAGGGEVAAPCAGTSVGVEPLEHAAKSAAQRVSPAQMAPAVEQARMRRIVIGSRCLRSGAASGLALFPVRRRMRPIMRLRVGHRHPSSREARRAARAVARAGAALLAALAALAAACQGGDEPLLCGEIPEGGCPVGRGGTCADRVCAGLYDCVQGAWTLVTRCDQPDVGAGGAGGGPGPDAGDGGCAVVPIDHTGEAEGCTPDLQHPDCPASAAETCEQAACLGGCFDFFLCKGEGWVEVAYCTEEGQIVVIP